MRDAVYDFSRRFVNLYIPMLSLREFIYLKEGIMLDVLENFSHPTKIVKQIKDKRLNILKAFREHISRGIRPIFVEGDYENRVKSALEKTIFYDIPMHLATLSNTHLKAINSFITHLLFSPIPTINITKFSNEWQISKEKLYFLLDIMQRLDLIRIIRQINKRSANSKGSKIFLSDPSLYWCFKGDIANAREAYFVFSVSYKHKDIFVPKDETECDFIVDGVRFEIGGFGKKIKKAQWVVEDGLEFPIKNRLPLWLFSFEY